MVAQKKCLNFGNMQQNRCGLPYRFSNVILMTLGMINQSAYKSRIAHNVQTVFTNCLAWYWDTVKFSPGGILLSITQKFSMFTLWVLSCFCFGCRLVTLKPTLSFFHFKSRGGQGDIENLLVNFIKYFYNLRVLFFSCLHNLTTWLNLLLVITI